MTELALYERVHSILVASPTPQTAPSVAILLGITPLSAREALRYLRTISLADSVRGEKPTDPRKWHATTRPVRHLPLVLGHVSRGGVERRLDCIHDDDCLGKLVRQEPEAEQAQCRAECQDYRAVDREAEFMHLAMSSVGGGWGGGDEDEEAAE